MRALCESVRLNASMSSLSRSALANSGSRLVPLGGFNSAVTTNFPDSKTSTNGRAFIHTSAITGYLRDAVDGVDACRPMDRGGWR